ncbi:MAG: DUF2254 domain-containing protein [Pseudomonadaceae bacterium]|nr:DUF2254 domain-containing protein [Pseudomonadaceae bacterium]
MNAHNVVVDLLDRIRSSYWFLPSLMALGALLLAGLMIQLDLRVANGWLAEKLWLQATPEGARAVLATVAGSMITVAGVTFSMTLLAISHASAQIGPRLLTGFMKDRRNQFTLGVFVATFLYCLIILRAVRDGLGQTEANGFGGEFVPELSVLMAVALSVLCVATLIFFIHHVTRSIDITIVVDRVGCELMDDLSSLYPARVGADGARIAVGQVAALTAEAPKVLEVDIESGYLRIVDGELVIDCASQHGLIVELLLRPGDFAVEGQPLMQVWSAHAELDTEVARELLSAFSWGRERDSSQDALYPLEQLIEVFGRALSPGVNNQYVALLCIHQFERAIATMLRADIPSAIRLDEKAEVRALAQPLTHEVFLGELFGPVRQFARGDWLTVHHLLKMLDSLSSVAALAPARDLLQAQRMMMEREINESAMAPEEKARLLSGEST